jgi:hypothetical protein
MDSKCSERAAGEKAARMQPSANGTGLEGANRKFATGSRVQPQLKKNLLLTQEIFLF